MTQYEVLLYILYLLPIFDIAFHCYCFMQCESLPRLLSLICYCLIFTELDYYFLCFYVIPLEIFQYFIFEFATLLQDWFCLCYACHEIA